MSKAITAVATTAPGETDAHIPAGAYGSWCNWEILAEVDLGARRVLSIGCGEGATEAVLAARGAEVSAVEMNSDAAARAAQVLSGVIVGDIEAINLPFARATFDCLICADVLEHLRSPRETLERLLPLLRPGGQVIVSLPNVRFYSVSMGLLWAGRWAYQPSGILDATHLRFFTLSSACELFAVCGLGRPLIRRVYRVADLHDRSRMVGRLVRTVLPVARRLAGLRELFVWQYVLVACKGP